MGWLCLTVPTCQRMREPCPADVLLINVITGAVVSPRIIHPKRVRKIDRNPRQIRALGIRPSDRQRRRKQVLREKNSMVRRVGRVGRTALLHNPVPSVHDVMPRAAVPMIVTRKVKNPRARHIQRDIPIVGQLFENMAGIRPFIAALASIRAAHISPRADSLLRPVVPSVSYTHLTLPTI